MRFHILLITEESWDGTQWLYDTTSDLCIILEELWSLLARIEILSSGVGLMDAVIGYSMEGENRLDINSP